MTGAIRVERQATGRDVVKSLDLPNGLRRLAGFAFLCGRRPAVYQELT